MIYDCTRNELLLCSKKIKAKAYEILRKFCSVCKWEAAVLLVTNGCSPIALKGKQLISISGRSVFELWMFYSEFLDRSTFEITVVDLP